MYNCSNDFHKAVADGNPQKALLIFSDCVFTDEDINVENGIQFNDYFNTEEDLMIGQATSNEIRFSLFNDDRTLNNYKFGEFEALLGVQYATQGYVQDAPVTIVTGKATYTGFNEFPYIKRNDVQLSAQPSFPVKAIFAYNEKIYAFSSSGKCVVYNDNTGVSEGNINLNAFMKAKVQTWAGKGIYYNKSTHKLKISELGVTTWYEFVPLGTFVADRPKAPDVMQIDMDCFDKMQKFDDDMPSKSTLGITYPATIGTLFTKLCGHVGVPYKSSTFINSTAKIQKEPDDFKNATMRDVLKWIAEAAGANARFNRDGILELAWLKTTSQQYEATDYSDFNPYWYKTKKVTRIYNRDTHESKDITSGSKGEDYLIQDNPLLKGVT